MDYIKASQPAAGFDEVLYPGELEARTSATRTADGVPVDANTVQALRELLVEGGGDASLLPE